MDAVEAILSKRDTRSFRADPIDDAVLERVLQAARMAGSAKNAQILRLILVTDAEVRSQLPSCGDFANWVDSAPAMLVFAIPVDGGRLFDVGRTAQNAMVAAHALGLASCPVTFHHQQRIREVLGVPVDHEAPMGVGLGWPGGGPTGVGPSGARLPFETLVHRDRW